MGVVSRGSPLAVASFWVRVQRFVLTPLAATVVCVGLSVGGTVRAVLYGLGMSLSLSLLADLALTPEIGTVTRPAPTAPRPPSPPRINACRRETGILFAFRRVERTDTHAPRAC